MLNLAVTIPFAEPPSCVGRESDRKMVCGRRRAPPRFEKIDRVGFHLWCCFYFPIRGRGISEKARYLPVGPDRGPWPNLVRLFRRRLSELLH